MSRGGGKLPPALAAAAVLVLVGVVAVAATGSTPAGTSAGRRPSELVLDTFFTLSLLALVPAAALFVWALTQRKAIAQEIASGRYRRTSMLSFLVFITLFTGVVYLLRERGGLLEWGSLGETVEVGPDGQVTIRDASAYDEDAYRAEIAWIPAAVVAGLALVAVAAYVLAARRRDAVLAPDEAQTAAELAGVLEEALDDLRAEPDARRAVVAAFARLERTLAASGLPRARSETAQEYVSRALERLDVDPRPAARLVGLFSEAKFSEHLIDEGMKARAIDSLEEIRDALREAAARREAEAEALPAAPERAAAS